jgi:hypothetical protein
MSIDVAKSNRQWAFVMAFAIVITVICVGVAAFSQSPFLCALAGLLVGCDMLGFHWWADGQRTGELLNSWGDSLDAWKDALAMRSAYREELGRLQAMGVQVRWGAIYERYEQLREKVDNGA